MKLRSRARASLFARMSLLFAVLVTVPLLISNIVLSLASRQRVYESGEGVRQIGQQAVADAVDKFRPLARNILNRAANSMGDIGQTGLQKTSDEAVDTGRKVLEENTQQMSDRGQKTVGNAVQGMVKVGQDTLAESLSKLNDNDKEALYRLHAGFNNALQSAFKEKISDARKSLVSSTLNVWRLSADRRALSIQDYATRARSEMVLRLDYPIRTGDVVQGQASAGRVLSRFVLKSERAGLEVVRAVLVSETGTEIVRVPDTDTSGPTDEGEDWEANPTRDHLMRSKLSTLFEPVRYDERSKHWIMRIAEKVPRNESASDMPPAGQTVVPRTPFVVVDLEVDNLVELATPESLPDGMQVLVLQPQTGKVVSSLPKVRPGDPVVSAVIAALPRGKDRALATSTTPLHPDVKDAAGATVYGVGRYWIDDDLWTVVIQPSAGALAPVGELEDAVKRAWTNAQLEVESKGEAFINEQANRGRGKTRDLESAAAREMRAQEASIMKGVRADFLQAQAKHQDELAAKLKTTVAALRDQARADMTRQKGALTAAAVGRFGEAAKQETAQASAEIDKRAREVANRTAGQMLVNSAWLIPLFLILALFLATLTARSLVRPINQLVKGTQAVAAGDFHQRIQVRGDDELARLALAFNNMAGAVEMGQAELQQSHDTLATEKARIEAIVNASPDGLVMLEPSGQVAFINPTAIRMLGLRASEVPPAPFETAQLPEAAAARLTECIELAKSAEGTSVYEPGGEPRQIFQVRDVPVRALRGRSYGRLLHIHDITRERIIDEMKSDFISLVSHELRTPLTSILGFSSYLLTGRLGAVAETQKMALESIHRQAKRLSAIISDFLDISRIESGCVELKRDAVPVTQIANRVLEDLRPQAAEKNIHVEAHVQGVREPLSALGDEQRIAQVFTNLVGNALKFTERDGAVDVFLSRQNGDVLCRVKDTGCGIPQEELDRVFDRFYQVEKVVTRKSGGTGLGLAIVKNIIEAHGGRVWIESRVGEGTQVSFTLPATDALPAGGNGA